MSDVKFDCPECGQKYDAPPKMAGRKFDCQKCGVSMTVPGPVEAPQGDDVALAEEETTESPSPKPKIVSAAPRTGKKAVTKKGVTKKRAVSKVTPPRTPAGDDSEIAPAAAIASAVAVSPKPKLFGLQGRYNRKKYFWFTFVPFASPFCAVKRLHDMGRPGTHFWMLLIPVYGILLSFILLFKKGTQGENTYGPDPLAK
jgi:hypothetical protein